MQIFIKENNFFLYCILKCVKILFLSLRMDQICFCMESMFENFLCL